MNECKADRWSIAFPSNVSMAVSCLSRRLLPSRGVCSKRGRPFRDALCVLIRGRNVLTRWKWSNVSGNQWPNTIRFLFFIQDKYMFKQLENTYLFLICTCLPSENNYVIVILCIIQWAIRFFSWKNGTRVVQAYYKNLNTYCCYSSTIHLSIIQTSLKLYAT